MRKCRGSKTRTLGCGLAQIAALKRHWRFIHYRDQFESFHHNAKKEPTRTGGFLFGRGSKTRTHKNGFGDRYVTITSCPYILRSLPNVMPLNGAVATK